MSRFYGDLQGNRGEATRCGTAGSGISAHPRGWSLGVRVFGYPVMGDSERDEFSVTITGGSNGRGRNFSPVNVRENPDGTREVRYFAPSGELMGIYTIDRDNMDARPMEHAT